MPLFDFKCLIICLPYYVEESFMVLLCERKGLFEH